MSGPLDHGTSMAESGEGMERVHDSYQLLEYYTGKLDTWDNAPDIFDFYLQFVQTIIAGRHGRAEGCVFLAGEEGLELAAAARRPEEVSQDCFDSELKAQIESGMVGWCMANRKLGFTAALHGGHAANCLIAPLCTSEQTVGLLLLYTDLGESDISRESYQILGLASVQTSLYVDNLAAYARLRDAQAGLIQSEKLASLGQLAAGIAHEISNPVGFVKSNSDTLAGYVERLTHLLELYRGGAAAETIRRAEREAGIDAVLEDIGPLVRENLDGLERIAEIVGDLKNLARADTRQALTESDLGAIVRSALLIARNEMKYHAELKLDVADVAPVPCNGREITQVLLNLIVNAAQAIKEQQRPDRGLVTVRVREDGDWVRCEVSDDGPGIPEDDRERVFEPFFTTKSPGLGTGLGLHICRDIVVNRHGGTIEMESEEGEGTTFVVSLRRGGE